MYAGHILGLLWDFPSFVLVVGGTIASTIMTYPWETIKHAPRSLLLTFFPQKRTTPHATIERLCELSEIAAVRGIDVLPDQLSDDDDDFLKAGVKMLLNDWDEQDLKDSMEKEMESMLERHQQVQKAFASAGGYAPVYGLLGTLVGELGVLRYLGDPAAMGNAMTVAIVTTFYGIFIANFVALPTAGKLESYSNQELLLKQLILIAVLSIKKEEYPYMLRNKLEKHVAHSQRKEA
jgi:chemotaxis protein MotA